MTITTKIEFELYGVILTIVSCVASALKGVMTKYLQIHLRLSPSELLRPVSLISACICFIVTIFNGNLKSVFDSPTSIETVVHLLANASLAAFVNLSSFHASKIVSPLALNITANVKHTAISLISTISSTVATTTIAIDKLSLSDVGILFDQIMGDVSLCKQITGIIITCIGAILYARFSNSSIIKKQVNKKP